MRKPLALRPRSLHGIAVGALLGLVARAADAAPGPEPREGGAVFYVNFDGAVIEGGTDDARTNTSEVAEQFGFTGSYPAYGGSAAQRAAVMSALRSDWSPFDVVLVDARPAQGEYAMVLMGPLDSPLGMGINSAGPIDCEDANRNNVAFVFYGAEDLGGSASASVQATESSQEFAHAVGLEHVGGSGSEADVMVPTNASPTASFVDECFTLAAPVACESMHAALSGCVEAGHQNSFQELMALLGPASIDDQAPSVAIASPADGETFDAGVDIEVRVDAADDVAVTEVVLALDDHALPAASQPPFEWVITDVDEGEHTLSVLARDAAGNESTAGPVSFRVQRGAVDPEGCGCASGRGSERGWGWLALLAFFAGRNRGSNRSRAPRCQRIR